MEVPHPRNLFGLSKPRQLVTTYRNRRPVNNHQQPVTWPALRGAEDFGVWGLRLLLISHLSPRGCACLAQSRTVCVYHLDERPSRPVRGVSAPWGARDSGELGELPKKLASGEPGLSPR